MRALSCPPVFVVGHPRSGTTWLTKLLGMHPRLGSVSETHLFAMVEMLRSRSSNGVGRRGSNGSRER